MLKGAAHVHSTYTDSEFTLAELRQIFLDEGCAFACMTDHAEHLDSDRLKQYIAECASLSDEKLFFVPGLEYECERRMHILGYGATRLIDSKDPQTVIREIENQGAISVIAHPKDDFFDWIRGFQTLPQGIEAWNSKYDGRYAPRPGTFALIRELRTRRPEMRGFYGQDLHWKKQFRELFVEVEVASPDSQSVLAAFAAGNYCGVKGELVLQSSAVLDDEQAAKFASAHARSYRMWRLLKGGKQVLDRIGIGVPESLKSQLRRIF